MDAIEVALEECSELLKNLKSKDKISCTIDGEKLFLLVNLEGLKSIEEAFEILDEVRNNVPKQINGKPIRVNTWGVFKL